MAETAWWQACWRSKTSTAFTVLMLLALAPLCWALFDWALWQAVWQPDPQACTLARGQGACWGVITEKHRLILFGRYPQAEQWRATLACALLIATLLYAAHPSNWSRRVPALWLLALAVAWVLMSGRLGPWSLRDWGLPPVPSELWGGLPLTLMLSAVAITLAFPLAIALALGRSGPLPLIARLCAILIEVVRGVPLVSVLFMASFMIPLWWPAGQSPDVLWRVSAALTLFLAAYLAEVVRGGLQGVPPGQTMAGTALGLGYFDLQRHVVLPQALTHALPGLVNHFIGLFKDTSLVTIVSLYELSGAMSLALSGDTQWRPFKIEAYLFIAAIYFVFCAALSRYSLFLQHRLDQRRR
ncbi:MAG: Inner rane amino-acid transporter permease protein YhdY [Pseudomonadota bacterium]|jgi:general L-amino acid transport system permease protein